MIDKYEREIDYVRISITDRCNFRCQYCMPEKGIEKKSHDEILRFEEIITLIKTLTKLGIKKIRFTGGEPLVAKNITELIYRTSKIEGIEDIAITTNGSLLEEMAEELFKAGLKRVNVSLDTLDEKKFKDITRGGNLKQVLRGIDKCLDIGMTPVKINTVLIKGFNDDEINDLISLTKDKAISVRFIELMPIGEGKQYYDNGMITAGEVIEKLDGLIPVKTNKVSTAVLYSKKGYKGTIGFISPLSCKFCDECNRIRVTSIGTIKPCLHSKEEIDIKPFLENEIELYEELKKTIFNKPKEHFLNEEKVTRTMRKMNQIGG
ncbi:GTP 3',8-cyclase MoaA [Clostridium sp. DL1XJH146]